jgi:hypothetical protein
MILKLLKSKIIEDLTQEYSINIAPLLKENETSNEEKTSEEDTEQTDSEGEEAAKEKEDEEIDETSEELKVSQRTPLIIEDKLAYGTTIISEITMNNMFLFCTNKFVLGSAVVIEFLVPKIFSVSGIVAHCREVNMKTRVISDKKCFIV